MAFDSMKVQCFRTG